MLEVEVWEVVVVCEAMSLGFLVPEVEPLEPATGATVADVMSWRSLRRAAGTQVLLTCVGQSKPRLLQQVLHLLLVQSFFAWFPQSWHVVPPLLVPEAVTSPLF